MQSTGMEKSKSAQSKRSSTYSPAMQESLEHGKKRAGRAQKSVAIESSGDRKVLTLSHAHYTQYAQYRAASESVGLRSLDLSFNSRSEGARRTTMDRYLSMLPLFSSRFCTELIAIPRLNGTILQGLVNVRMVTGTILQGLVNVMWQNVWRAWPCLRR